MAKVSFQHVSKIFSAPGASSGTAALTDFCLDIRPGEFVTLVGPSGCGKSTLLDMVAGLSRPSSGHILLDGRPIDGPGLDRSIVFQQYALFPWRTALGNVAFGLEALGLPKAERRERARHFLALVGLANFMHHYPHQLSGGMKQRVAIARGLSVDPEVLLMDEPFAALDAQTRERLQDELLRIWRQTGKTILFVTHGIEEAIYLGQRVVVLAGRPGRVIDTIDIGSADFAQDEDRRAAPEFGRLRHRVWTLLRDDSATSAIH